MDEYDELASQIYELRNNFFREYGIKPNTVYIGHDEFYTLRECSKNWVLNLEYPKQMAIFGLNVKRVTEDNYISVGLVFEK